MQADTLSLTDNTKLEIPTQQTRQNNDAVAKGEAAMTTTAQRCVKEFYNCGQDIESVVVLSIN